jgi:hypothetical protein
MGSGALTGGGGGKAGAGATGGIGGGAPGSGGVPIGTGGVTMPNDGSVEMRDAPPEVAPDAGVDLAPDGGGGGAGGGSPPVCGADVADCNKDPRDGCETSIDSVLNCGRCGNSCQAANASSACVNRQCAPLTCTAGFDDCNLNRVDGCETALTDDLHCGTCEHKCISPTPFCGLVGTARTCSNPAQALVDQRLELACGPDTASETCSSLPTAGAACPEGGKITRRSFTMGGRAGVVYNVTLRIRGVVEPKVYAGGRGPGDHFYVGGTPTVTNYNSYSLVVSSPAQTYYLNYDEAVGEAHYVFTLDHMKVIQVAGGATINMEVTDRDCAMVKNCQSFDTATCAPYIVAGVPPAPAGFNGQFVHFDVVAVEAAF